MVHILTTKSNGLRWTFSICFSRKLFLIAQKQAHWRSCTGSSSHYKIFDRNKKLRWLVIQRSRFEWPRSSCPRWAPLTREWWPPSWYPDPEQREQTRNWHSRLQPRIYFTKTPLKQCFLIVDHLLLTLTCETFSKHFSQKITSKLPTLFHL